MSPSSYLLHVNSRPTIVSDKLWTQWYTTEHIPDLVNSHTSTRAAFYEEIPFPFNPNPDHPRKFLAFYQTDFEECLKTENYLKTRRTSDLFPKEGGGEMISDNGDLDARNYRLIQEFNPNGSGEKPSPNILTIEMHPQDAEDFDKWCREEHLDLLSKVPGYKRSLRYWIGPKTALTKGEPPDYLAVHEVDDVTEAFGSKEAIAASATPWSEKHMKDSKVLVARAWKLIEPVGY